MCDIALPNAAAVAGTKVTFTAFANVAIACESAAWRQCLSVHERPGLHDGGERAQHG